VPRTPFFITGAPRSGSTFLYYILKTHPKVAFTNEARVLDAISLAFEALTLPFGVRSGGSGMMGLVSAESAPVLGEIFRKHARQIFEEFYEQTFDHDFTHFGDKLPDPHSAGMAARLDPNVRIVMLVRDPRDVVCSFRSLQKSDHDLGPRGDEMRAQPVSHFAHLWRNTYDILLELAPTMHRVDYVDLIRRTRVEVVRMLEFLRLPMTPEVEHAIATNDTIGGHGTSRTAEESIGRWRRDLPAEDTKLVEEVCGPMMARLGLTA
jgi:Sulfotransferase family